MHYVLVPEMNEPYSGVNPVRFTGRKCSLDPVGSAGRGPLTGRGQREDPPGMRPGEVHGACQGYKCLIQPPNAVA